MNIYAQRRNADNLENDDKPFDCTVSLHSASPEYGKARSNNSQSNKFNDDNEVRIEVR